MIADTSDFLRHANPDLPIRVPDDFRIIAHRGASAYAPESTAAAFLKALELGAREIELDVQLSSDGIPMICHDHVLDRYGHAGISIADTPAAVLQNLDMGTWFGAEWSKERMLTLRLLLEQFGDQFTYHIEIKRPADGIERCVAEEIARHGLEGQTFVTSFHYDCLRVLHEGWPSFRLGWLVRQPGITAERIGLAERIHCAQICPPCEGLTSAAVRNSKCMTDEVRAHHVRTPQDAWRVVATGCNGMTINNPDWLQHQSR